MRIHWGLFGATLATIAFFAGRGSMAGGTESKLDSLAFLAGSWERKVGNVTMEEHWTRPAGGCMMGMMRQVTDGRVSVREFILLEESEEGMRMTVKHVGARMEDVPGRAFVLKLARFDGKEALFENGGDGTLKAVIYRKEDESSLFSAIRVERNGQIRQIDLPFKRMESR